MDMVILLLGIFLLVMGRRLFWLYVGIVGFAFGLEAAEMFFRGQPEWVGLLAACLTGLVCAVLAVAVQKFALALAGFFAGGYLVHYFLTAVNPGQLPGNALWIAVLVGGLIGGVWGLVFFQWALVILSSMVGAVMTTQGLGFDPSRFVWITAGLFLAGIVIQLTRGSRSETESRTE